MRKAQPWSHSEWQEESLVPDSVTAVWLRSGLGWTRFHSSHLESDLAGSLCPTGGKGYGPEHGGEDFAAFRAWLQCYSMPGMSSLRDRNGRTIWFQVGALLLRQAYTTQGSWGVGGDAWGPRTSPRATSFPVMPLPSAKPQGGN